MRKRERKREREKKVDIISYDYLSTRIQACNGYCAVIKKKIKIKIKKKGNKKTFLFVFNFLIPALYLSATSSTQ